jgi:hypothetical protein
MKYLILAGLILISLSEVSGQSQQRKSFYVNAYTFYGSFKTDRKPMCDGLEIIITTEKINIGDDDNLKITSKELIDGKTKYLVEDPKGQITGVFHGITKGGNDYLQLVFKSDKGDRMESGLIFQYWDHVDSYNFWKYDRKSKKP